MGLPLAAQFASHGWSVIAVDIDPARRRRRSTTGGRTSARSPGVAELVADAHAAGRLRATHRRRRGGARGRRRRAHRAGHARRRARIRITARWTPPSTRSPRVCTPARLVIFETTLPVGDTRGRYAPRLAAGVRADRSRTTCSSRSRRSGCTAAPPCATWRPTRSSSAGSARRRPRGPRRSTTASSTPTSWRCRRPRRPSSRSSPTRPTAT